MGKSTKCDAMAKNPRLHESWHWVRGELVQYDGKSASRPENHRNPEQVADITAKALPRPKHQKHTEDMGLVSA
jgi:hypothetical protein